MRPEDLKQGPYLGRDAFIIIEGEKRQFDKGKDYNKVHRFVEHLYTGEYVKTKKDFNPNVVRGPVSEEQVQINKKAFD